MIRGKNIYDKDYNRSSILKYEFHHVEAYGASVKTHIEYAIKQIVIKVKLKKKNFLTNKQRINEVESGVEL